MPRCHACAKVQPTVEVRRLPAGRFVCKDVSACHRRQEQAEKQLALFEREVAR
jgi:hypothetical protein